MLQSGNGSEEEDEPNAMNGGVFISPLKANPKI